MGEQGRFDTASYNYHFGLAGAEHYADTSDTSVHLSKTASLHSFENRDTLLPARKAGGGTSYKRVKVKM